jgi:hypothetical protein
VALVLWTGITWAIATMRVPKMDVP